MSDVPKIARLGSRDLVLTNGCASYSSFETQVKVAASNGFAGISIWPSVYSEARDRGVTTTELRSLLGDHGVVVNDVDAAMLWVGADERPPRTPHDGPPYEVLFEAGAELGADYCNVAILGDAGYSFSKAVDQFGAAATRALEAGLVPHLEFMPLGPIEDAATAWAVVQSAGIPEAGILVDAFHVQRGSTDETQLRGVPPDKILGVQLCDARAERPDDLRWEALHGRLLPGEGAGDTVGLVRLLDDHGSDAPLSVEVLSDELARLTPDEAAATVAAATRRVLAIARGSS